jgi:Aminotransferase class-V
VFTASGSEADNLAIKGIALARLGERDHLITSAVEHPAVLGAGRYLECRLGYRVTIVPVDAFGRYSRPAITDEIASRSPGRSATSGRLVEEDPETATEYNRTFSEWRYRREDDGR